MIAVLQISLLSNTDYKDVAARCAGVYCGRVPWIECQGVHERSETGVRSGPVNPSIDALQNPTGGGYDESTLVSQTAVAQIEQPAEYSL